jgi:hypothetical protein
MVHPRALMALAFVFAHVSTAYCETPIEVLEATVQANRALGRGYAGDAVAILEKHLAVADGDRAFNDALRAAYTAQLKELSDPLAQAKVRSKLTLLNQPAESIPLPAIPGSEPAPVAKPAEKPQGIDLLQQATAAFNQAGANDVAKFLTARNLFELAVQNKVKMNSEQTAAWAYCRVKVAADKLNKSSDANTSEEVAREIEDALATVPEHKGLQQAGTEVIALAKQRTNPKPTPVAATAELPAWQMIETDCIRVKFRTNKSLAQEIARTAEIKRGEIFRRWSGPPGGDWNPKCDIILHPDGASFAEVTKHPAAGTGRAEVTLQEGRVTIRRIDLRADDTTVVENALPRELTHIVLADLFPSQPPPRWAELGMGVLATTDGELSRYLRTMPKVAKSGWIATGKLIVAADTKPDDDVTAFHVQSVSLVEFLVRWQGEKAFTSFLRDAQRYGVESAIQRQYGLRDSKQLETEWKKVALAGRD